MLKKKRSVLFLLVALGGTLLAVVLFRQASYTLDAFQVHVAVAFRDFAYSELHFPPLGVVRARTHFSPLQLTVALQSTVIPTVRVSKGLKEPLFLMLVLPVQPGSVVCRAGEENPSTLQMLHFTSTEEGERLWELIP